MPQPPGRPLLGCVALVYDATAPAGAAAAHELARLGAWTACALRERHEQGKALVDAIRMDGGRALLLAGDPAHPREAWTMLQRLEAEWGPATLVVLVPSPGDPPECLRDGIASLIEAGVGTLAADARFLLALPSDADTAALPALAPPGICVAGVRASGDATATGHALVQLALTEPCPRGAFIPADASR